MSQFDSRSQARRKTLLAEYAQLNRHGCTPSEQALWAAIRGSALGIQFRRQVPIDGLFIADFLASECKLIVEVDGSWHRSRRAADVRRDIKLQRMGFTVLRLPAALVERQLPVALQRIREAVETLLCAVR